MALMSLKDLFRYQKFLKGRFDSLDTTLKMPRYRYRTEEIVKVSALDDTLFDKVTEVSDDAGKIPTPVLISLYLELAAELVDVGDIITKLKHKLANSYDNLVSANIVMRQAADTLSHYTDCVATSRLYPNGAKVYRVLPDGTQGEFYVDKVVNTYPQYTPETASDMRLKILSATDMVSSMLDEMLITEKIEFTPCFNVNASLAKMADEINTQAANSIDKLFENYGVSDT